MTRIAVFESYAMLVIELEFRPWIVSKYEPSTLLILWTPLFVVPTHTQPFSSCSIDVMSPGSSPPVNQSPMSIGALHRLSPLSMMSIMLPEAIQNSPDSPSSIIAVTSASSIEGLLTRWKDPSELSSRIRPNVPDESPIIAIDSEGALGSPPGHALMLEAVPNPRLSN